MKQKRFAAIAMVLAAVATFLLPAGLHAALVERARAPNFSTQVALAGQVQGFALRAALRRGPVVLYFYPKAFTKGCTLETRAFAEAHDRFVAAGATVIGLSADDLPTLQRFSVEECRGKFPVGVATPGIIRAYDVSLGAGAGSAVMTSRTSYVIGQNGRIAMVHADSDYRDHVRLTLQAVEAMARARQR